MANNAATVEVADASLLDAMIRKKLNELGREIREFKLDLQEYQTKVRKALLSLDAADNDGGD
ncbi:MAG: hypothetical protein JRN52_05120 [Nitrososphaerota archaeon]|nr:hypothetical protein [Nitrososphaerota archaeon]